MFDGKQFFSYFQKSVLRSAEAMDKHSQESSQDRVLKFSCSSSSSNTLQSKAHDIDPSNTSAEPNMSSPSIECCILDNEDVLGKVPFRKSQSLGSGLDREGRVPFDADEDDVDQCLSCDDDSPGKNIDTVFNDFDHNGSSAELFVPQDSESHLFNQCMEPVLAVPLQNNDNLVHAESIFSIGESQQIGIEVQQDFDTQLFVEHVGDSDYHSSDVHARRIGKSCSFPDLKVVSTIPEQDLFMGPRSKSFEGLVSIVDEKGTEYLRHEDGSCFRFTFSKPEGATISQTTHFLGTGSLYQEASLEDCFLCNRSGGSYEVGNEERGHICRGEKHTCENQFDDSDSCNLTGFGMQWASPEIEEVDVRINPEHEILVPGWDGMSNKDFNSKRIKDWVNKIDLQNSSPLHEEGDCSHSSPKAMKDLSLTSGVSPGKFDAMVTPGMEAANRYISSLTAISSSAQMANLGLSVIPFVSAYTSLRVLNLSGNAIVRITAGALPRGLHVLNLSKNSISTIEGLRELTRLRMLDLSYNRIFKIGHGLASCSSLKELYLAGNKISEVEGLHRLLKLNILDLRFNKISTAKCLDQLAANYGSLQAINLVGNPAQKNVGDEQLKKYLVGLLPRLLYFNGQMIRNSSLKEVADRPARSVAAYQLDRSLRSEHKLGRRGSHGVSTHKLVSSSTHGRSIQAVGSPKRVKGRHGRLPPSVLRGTHNQMDSSSSRLSLQSSHSIRRSRSEGTL
eukprot:TRINITY_DN28446_c0_g1_i3.p1 TRINITY_DN28446_c0_g1~~TRINITY_DN28446_c0_g1_i3.p1  ORF type:complete len:733 (-),score=148.29 TRINITY_DN28446_c0_g1_i3:474-2672(-)